MPFPFSMEAQGWGNLLDRLSERHPWLRPKSCSDVFFCWQSGDAFSVAFQPPGATASFGFRWLVMPILSAGVAAPVVGGPGSSPGKMLVPCHASASTESETPKPAAASTVLKTAF